MSPIPERQRLGPWLKLYASIVDSKAHYGDSEFRTLIEIYAAATRAIPDRGVFPNRAGLERKYGREPIAYLFEQGDLDELPDGRVAVHRWGEYQSGVLSTERTRRHREASANDGGTDGDKFGNSSEPFRERVVPTSTSISSSTDGENEDGVVKGRPEPDDHDALDRFYELTLIRPWGKRAGEWLVELQDAHGIPNVIAALEVESRDKPGETKSLLSRTAARLEAQAHRVRAAKERERQAQPRRSTVDSDPLLREIRASIDRPRGGPMQSLGDLLPSAQRSDRPPVQAQAEGRTTPGDARSPETEVSERESSAVDS